MSGVDAPVEDGWATVLGQEAAVQALTAAAADPVHAYLLVGPRGSGKMAAARAFAADLLALDPSTPDPERARRLALADQHPDVEVLKAEGARMSVDDAREIVRLTARSPVEGGRKVIVLPDFHLVERWGAMLLKSIEEPPPSTVFVVLAEDIPPDLVTVASRCVQIELGPVPAALVQAQLEREGVEAGRAADAAGAAAGDLSRARQLASDEGLVARRDAWAAVADRVDGTGATVARLVDELLELIEASAEPVKARQATELEELEERAEQYGEKMRLKPVQDRHKRELRQVRTAELRFGLATLARRYADRLDGDDPADALAAIGAIQRASEALIRNPNETLLLQALFLQLPPT